MSEQIATSMTKEMRQRFGVKGTPIVAVKAHTRVMAFDHTTIQTKSWFLQTSDGKLVQVNTYDGKAGKNYDPSLFTYDLPTGKDLEKKLRGYTEVPVADCPVAVLAPTAGAPATPPPAQTTGSAPPPTTETDVSQITGDNKPVIPAGKGGKK